MDRSEFSQKMHQFDVRLFRVIDTIAVDIKIDSHEYQKSMLWFE